MTGRRGVILMALAIGLLGARVTGAATQGLEIYGGVSRLGMGDINRSMASTNAQIGTHLAPIENGPGWGFAVRGWSTDRVMVRLGFESIDASSHDRDIDIEVACHAWTIGVVRWFPTEGKALYGLGANLGIHQAWGAITSSAADLPLGGNELGGGITAEGMWPLRGGWSPFATAGYRWAGVHDLEAGGFRNALRADWSGPYLHLGIAVDGDRGSMHTP